MGKYTRIPVNTFKELQMDVGILLKKFDPTGVIPVADEDIITATTGGVQVTCEPQFSDMGEDIDNCPNNMKELKHLDGWNCTMAFNSIGTSPESIKLSLGAADIDGQNTCRITPRRNLNQEDFKDELWWVGDKAGGGFVACCLRNALSTGGFSLQTTKNGKGQNSMTITGHVSIEDQDTMPMDFYSVEEGGVVIPQVELSAHYGVIQAGATKTLLASTIPLSATVTWTSSDTEVATVAGGVVTGVAEGNAIITATITEEEVDYTDTCTIVVEPEPEPEPTP